MRKQYDFSQGVVGKYAARYAQGTSIIVLDRDVARAPAKRILKKA